MSETLPQAFRYETMNDLVGENYDLVVDLLQESPTVIDDNLESVSAMQLSEYVVGALLGRFNQHQFEIGHTAYNFAVSVINMVSEGVPTIRVSVLNVETADEESYRHHLETVADNFLHQNPAIEDLVGMFMYDIDKTHSDYKLVERVSSLVFYMADENRKLEAIDAAVCDMQAELNAL